MKSCFEHNFMNWNQKFVDDRYRGGNGPRNISLNDVLNNCSALELSGSSTKLIWPGYTMNCNGTAPSQIRTDHKYSIFRFDLFSFIHFHVFSA